MNSHETTTTVELQDTPSVLVLLWNLSNPAPFDHGLPLLENNSLNFHLFLSTDKKKTNPQLIIIVQIMNDSEYF